MPVSQALMIALSGFLTVFFMLVLLWAIIEVINKVITAIESKEEKPPVPAAVSEPKPVRTETERPHGIYGGEIALYDVDEKTAACIMAIISDSTKIPLDQLIFKSIRALD